MDAPAVDSNASPRNDVGKNKEKTISRLMITKMVRLAAHPIEALCLTVFASSGTREL